MCGTASPRQGLGVSGTDVHAPFPLPMYPASLLPQLTQLIFTRLVGEIDYGAMGDFDAAGYVAGGCALRAPSCPFFAVAMCAVANPAAAHARSRGTLTMCLSIVPEQLRHRGEGLEHARRRLDLPGKDASERARNSGAVVRSNTCKNGRANPDCEAERQRARAREKSIGTQSLAGDLAGTRRKVLVLLGGFQPAGWRPAASGAQQEQDCMLASGNTPCISLCGSLGRVLGQDEFAAQILCWPHRTRLPLTHHVQGGPVGAPLKGPEAYTYNQWGNLNTDPVDWHISGVSNPFNPATAILSLRCLVLARGVWGDEVRLRPSLRALQSQMSENGNRTERGQAGSNRDRRRGRQRRA